MITRRHDTNEVSSAALYSDCERYRYSLTRVWDGGAPRVHFVMLNPSTATEHHNDPTIERCVRRSRALGFGALRVTNLFAWRDTDPRRMRTAADPIGPENDAAIREAHNRADLTICAWGTHGAYLQRGSAVERALRRLGRPLFHLGLGKAGHPRHPLYVAYAQRPTPWRAEEKAGAGAVNLSQRITG